MEENFEEVFEGIKKFLVEKNRRYGNSALEPLGVFTNHIDENDKALSGILVRLDDKLKRIKNAEDLRKNDVIDTIGYLIILCRHKNWTSFEEFID